MPTLAVIQPYRSMYINFKRKAKVS